MGAVRWGRKPGRFDFPAGAARSSEQAEIATEETTRILLRGLGGPAGFAFGALAGGSNRW